MARPWERLRRGLLLVVVLAFACGVTRPAAAAGEPVVVATIHPLTAIARELAGNWIDGHTLLPPGASPHTFEPRPGQMRTLAGASLIIAVGQGLDDWALQLARSAQRADVLLVGDEVAAAGLGIDFSGDEEHHHGEPAEEPHRHGGAIDPHVWLDPVLVRDVIAPAIARRLAAVLPGREAEIEANLRAFQEELSRLDADIARLLSFPGSKAFISYHSAWRYFARRYGLEEVATVAGFPGREPSARWVADVVRTAREHGVTVIFAEPQLSPKAAETIAREIGGQVLMMDPIGGPGLAGRERYSDLLRYNAGMLADALAAAR